MRSRIPPLERVPLRAGVRLVPLAALVLATVFAGACDKEPPIGPPPPPAGPQVSCASSITVEDVAGTSLPVTYPDPMTSAGAPPVVVTCTPPSGTQFPLGDTAVTCTATDALARQASCSFGITLRHRQLGLTRFLSFGDSITAGENGRSIGLVPFIDLANAYPTILQQFFSERIPAQQVTVVNAGLPGERAEDNDSRLKGEIARHSAEVLLLLEGINDLNSGRSPERVVAALRDNIRTAKDRGVQFVFVSTLLPVAPENCGPPPCRGLSTTNAIIAMTNQGIRDMVPARGGHLVDPYDLFFANRSTYIAVDGLHLRPEGNRALATAFWDKVEQVIPARQLFGF